MTQPPEGAGPPRRLIAFLAAALAISAAILRLQPTDPIPKAEAAMASPGGKQAAVLLYRAALARDNASPYRWADLAEALAATGSAADARRCFDRAIALGSGVPAIWLREANFFFQQNEPKAALRDATRVLQSVPDYDSVLFHYFDELVNDPALVLSYIGGQRRATRSWLAHLIAVNDATGARLAWDRIASAHFADDALAASYLDFLMRGKVWDQATATWTAYLDGRQGDYPQRNLLFNGGFESEPSGSILDWRIVSSNVFETVRDRNIRREGGYSMRIRFFGKENVSYAAMSQTAILPADGDYRVTLWIRTDGITTNEGLRLAVTDVESPARLDLKTNPITGSNDWMPLTLQFTSRKTRAIRVAIVRLQSGKFDNKIQGTVWTDSASLVSVRIDLIGRGRQPGPIRLAR